MRQEKAQTRAELEAYRQKILKLLKRSPEYAKKAAMIISEMIRQKKR